MNKKTITVLVLVLVLAAGAAAYALTRNSAEQSSGATSSPPNTQNPSTQYPTQPTGQETTFEGKVDCLPLRNPGEVQDLSCAIGLKADDGKNYGLNSSDPTITGSIPTGQRIRVKGALMEIASDKYDTAGTIQVSSVERL